MTRTLFYPCCGGEDLAVAFDAFADTIDVVHGADIRAAALSQFSGTWSAKRTLHVPHDFVLESEPNGPRGIRYCIDRQHGPRTPGRSEYTLTNRADGRSRRLVWHCYDAVEALRQIPEFHVFFARRDGSHDGEGASGIRWLDDILLERVLAKLARGGLLVTDGLRMGGVGAQSPLWRAPFEMKTGGKDPLGARFTAFGRSLECTGVFCATRAATLVWTAD